MISRDINQVMVEDIWQKVLSTYEGRFVINEIIGMTDVFGEDGPKTVEPHMLNRLEGRQEVCLQVLRRALTADPDVYKIMQNEARQFQQQLNEAGKEEDEDG